MSDNSDVTPLLQWSIVIAAALAIWAARGLLARCVAKADEWYIGSRTEAIFELVFIAGLTSFWWGGLLYSTWMLVESGYWYLIWMSGFPVYLGVGMVRVLFE